MLCLERQNCDAEKCVLKNLLPPPAVSVNYSPECSENVLRVTDGAFVSSIKLHPNSSMLEVLTIRECSLFELPLDVTCLTSIKSLDVSYNDILGLPFEIGHLVNLEHLQCRSNKITDIPSTFGRLTNLKVLDLSRNNISRLPSNLGFLQKLQVLDVSYNRLTEIPDRLLLSKNLQVLRAKKNLLKEIPSVMCHCINLVECDLSMNVLVELPTWLFSLPFLRDLDVTENRIKYLRARGIKDPLQLEFLGINKNMLMIQKQFDFKMFSNLKVLQLGNYERLHYTYNEMKRWNESLLSLTSLECLDCCGIGLRALPENIDQLDKLTWLDLSFNDLFELPKSICNLKRLRHLDLSQNIIACLPEEFGSLCNIECLLLNNNYLMQLPSSFETLKSLSHCDLSYNELSEFPEVFQSLTGIWYLDLYKNKFITVLGTQPHYVYRAILRSRGWKLQCNERQSESDADDPADDRSSEVSSDGKDHKGTVEEGFDAESNEDLESTKSEFLGEEISEDDFEALHGNGTDMADRLDQPIDGFEWDDNESDTFPSDPLEGLSKKKYTVRCTYQLLVTSYTDDMFKDAEPDALDLQEKSAVHGNEHSQVGNTDHS